MSTGFMSAVELVFWVAVAVPIYAYLGFPVLTAIAARLFHRPVRKAPFEPMLTILVPAYNEAAWIEQKIRNTLALDYPPDKLELLIASDGSRDRTVEIARPYEDGRRVRILDYKENSGKVAVLNKSVSEARGEIIVFSDAAAMLNREALRHVAANFADPRVGGVCGLYRISKPEAADIGSQEDFYWRYETRLKLLESQWDSILGGHGQLHALRKTLYPFPSPRIVNDDFVIPMRVVSQGYRVVYEPAATATEEAREMTGFGRRVRIMAGNIQQLSEVRRLFVARRWVPLFCLLSHKLSRLFVPPAMVVASIANLMLLGQGWVYQVTALGQAVFYLLALLGANWKLRPKLLLLPYYFCMVNAAAFAGVVHTIQGRRRMAWK